MKAIQTIIAKNASVRKQRFYIRPWTDSEEGLAHTGQEEDLVG